MGNDGSDYSKKYCKEGMFFENEVQLPIIITVDPENADPARISS